LQGATDIVQYIVPIGSDILGDLPCVYLEEQNICHYWLRCKAQFIWAGKQASEELAPHKGVFIQNAPIRCKRAGISTILHSNGRFTQTRTII